MKIGELLLYELYFFQQIQVNIRKNFVIVALDNFLDDERKEKKERKTMKEK